MNTPPDGGPAFPAEDTQKFTYGMSLRDYFAAQALMGMMANKTHCTTFNPESDANYVFKIADAMLAERLKTK